MVSYPEVGRPIGARCRFARTFGTKRRSPGNAPSVQELSDPSGRIVAQAKQSIDIGADAEAIFSTC